MEPDAALRDALTRPLLALLHHHADLDCVGSALGLAQSFPGTRLAATQGLNRAAQRLAEGLAAEIAPRPPAAWEGTVVVLDTPAPEHCAPLPAAERYLVLDHHQQMGEWPDGTLLRHDPEATSTAEVVLALLDELDRPLTAAAALPLLVALVADTGHFRHARRSSLAAAHRLCQAGAEPRDAFALMDREMRVSQRSAMLKAAQRLRWTQHGKWIIATSRIGAFEAGVARALTVMGADVGLVVSARGTRVRLSSRASRRVTTAGLNLARVLADFTREAGGDTGGHPGAAGYSGDGDAEAVLEMVRQRCLAALDALDSAARETPA